MLGAPIVNPHYLPRYRNEPNYFGAASSSIQQSADGGIFDKAKLKYNLAVGQSYRK